MQSVLSVSYDPGLLKTRSYLLESLQLEVISARGFTVALAACEKTHFDLLILGNSIPNEDKCALIEKFRQSCAAPVLELYSANEWPTGKAEHAFEMYHHPGEFLRLVANILGVRIEA